MKRAKFTLEHIFYPEVSVKANAAYDRDTEDTPNDPQVKIRVGVADEDNSFTMILRLVLDVTSPADPYDINLLVVGRFIGDASLTQEEQIKVIVKSGPNILYGAARDYVATLTSKSAWSELMLPPVIFDPSDFATDQPDTENQ
ncbi:Preprotein translocase subunit SecB [Azotobacter beijerinckii]|uniref:Preprotein translocase subunit SecB n=1 Tax=Azotobacter beijerinckii TaxID=170623 RepID=A0A1H6V8T2_9GAMM|nr:protein-export chaperone SecB [Azotobacter beijerinckii]SEI99314.1 Preprotein translocase subunit SecB [Azotobacter beijerinckii]